MIAFAWHIMASLASAFAIHVSVVVGQRANK
jgi:hypothetical protein